MFARFAAGLTIAVLMPPTVAQAATPLHGSELGWPWALPFIGLLASIASGPVLVAKFWHRHYGKLCAAWSALTLLAIGLKLGPRSALDALLHAMLSEYLGFIMVLFALFTVAGGILLSGDLGGRPLANTAMLALGTAIASLVGTTGAAMILVRPLIRANHRRRHKAHILVFFTFLAANIGGALTPLGDPPLFVGFLQGVDFFWTLRHLWLPTGVAALLLLAIFFVIDHCYFRADHGLRAQQPSPLGAGIGIYGSINVVLIALIVATISLTALWHPGISFAIGSEQLELRNVARDLSLLLIALLSLKLTPNEHRQANGFSWEPICEVAILFAGIFVCIVPVLAMLEAGPNGSFAWLLNIVSERNGAPHNTAYFWITGLLSAFLDNAPTYLVFFKLAGGHAETLMGPLSGTLAAISMGAVYMGALTYVGNAPNLMIYAIAAERGVSMPSFFAYMLWSVPVLVPLFLLLTVLFISDG